MSPQAVPNRSDGPQMANPVLSTMALLSSTVSDTPNVTSSPGVEHVGATIPETAFSGDCLRLKLRIASKNTTLDGG